MRIDEELLYKYSNGLELKRFFKNNTKGATYAIYQKGEFKGVISFTDNFHYNKNDLKINIMGLFLDTVKSGLATKLINIACKCGEEMGADELTIIYPFEKKIIAYDSKGRKRKYTKRRRIKVFKKIGGKLGKETYYDKDDDAIICKL